MSKKKGEKIYKCTKKDPTKTATKEMCMGDFIREDNMKNVANLLATKEQEKETYCFFSSFCIANQPVSGKFVKKILLINKNYPNSITLVKFSRCCRKSVQEDFKNWRQHLEKWVTLFEHYTIEEVKSQTDDQHKAQVLLRTR